ncbi:MAG TPA: dTDP-4-dehydrorhamnose 3,5-epimerase [Edaphocola sp.]|nr:dTDP-4-dehydrorhamnose 3,5-epimerase [Edaphocola sp.]
MTITETKLKDCVILSPPVFQDNRGYFFESFNQEVFQRLCGQPVSFVQDNQSYSGYGVIRGLHFQTGEYAQAKLIRVICGKVLDIAVDLRPASPTYLQWTGVELSGKNHLQLFIPRGFAHGFSVLENGTILAYKCDNYYDKASERGVRYDDPTLNIDWQVPEKERILSEKDQALPFLR